MQDQVTQNPIQEPIPNPVPQPTPKPQNNGVLITLSTLLIILVGVVAFLAYQNYQLQKQIETLKPTPSPTPTSTSDPTANWKTYTDPKYNFSFKYPSESVLQNQTVGQTYDYEVYASQVAKDINSAGTNVRFGIIGSTKSSYSDLAKSFHNHDSIWGQNPSQLYSDTQNASLAGVPTITFNTSVCPQQPGAVFYCEQTEYYFLSDGKVNYVISATHPIDQKQQPVNRELVDQILSTFKFADTNQAIDMSNWKTYTTSNQMDIADSFFQQYPTFKGTIPSKMSLKYPPSWDVFKINSAPYKKEILLFSLHKNDPKFANCQSEGPCENFADIQFNIGMTDSTVKDFDSNFWGNGYPIAKTTATTINGIGVSQVFNTNTIPIPMGTLFKISPNVELNVYSEFFNFNDKNYETGYSKQTVQEINQIISTITFTK